MDKYVTLYLGLTKGGGKKIDGQKIIEGKARHGDIFKAKRIYFHPKIGSSEVSEVD